MYHQQLTAVDNTPAGSTLAGGASVNYDIIPAIGRPVLSVIVFSSLLAVTLRIYQSIDDSTGTPVFLADPYTAAIPAATTYSVIFAVTGKYVRVGILAGAGVTTNVQVYSELRMQ